MIYTAHINEKGNVQTCKAHCRNTAAYGASNLASVELEKTAYLAGLLHDCGKFTSEFTDYITKANAGVNVKKGSVIHSFAGVFFLMQRYHKHLIPDFENLTAELISFAIGSHHCLFDCIDKDGKNGYEHRLTKQPDYEEKAITNYLDDCAGIEEIDRLFQKSCEEITHVYQKILEIPGVTNDECQFYVGLLARLLTSAVIDGDRRDTAEFMSGTDFSSMISGNSQLWQDVLKSLEFYLCNFSKNSDIEIARNELSDYCKEFAYKPSKIYRLNLPTGAGKTLSGLRYAVTHAVKYDKKRIFYVAPLISILDQNAKIIKEAVGTDELVLEHHSNVIMDQDDSEELNQYQLLTETWDSPIVVTTLVQFLNTLFSGKTSCIRRMKSLCSSVIIIDEVQTVPTKMLSLFNLAINFLSEVCNSDILLCSATQPCLEEADHPMIISNEEIISSEKWNDYINIFKRTNIIDAGRMDIEEGIIPFVQKLSEKYASILVVCNKKSEAMTLFKVISEQVNVRCFHLSSGMCMAHRRVILEQMQDCLNQGIPLICISTQVIEAGVDISFSAGIRLTAGMDNIVQTAGRINRHGEMNEIAPVYIIGCVGEDLSMLKEISEAKNASDELLAEFEIDPSKFKNDLSSKEATDYYYRTLYRHMKHGQQNYSISGNTSIYNLLTDNLQALKYTDKQTQNSYFMQQAFSEAGKLFTVMDENTETVIVPYKEGKNIIAELSASEAKFDYVYRRELINKAKEYSINIFNYQIRSLEKANAIQRICDGSVLVLSNESYYDSESIGLDPEGGSGEWSTLIL